MQMSLNGFALCETWPESVKVGFLGSERHLPPTLASAGTKWLSISLWGTSTKQRLESTGNWFVTNDFKKWSIPCEIGCLLLYDFLYSVWQCLRSILNNRVQRVFGDSVNRSFAPNVDCAWEQAFSDPFDHHLRFDAVVVSYLPGCQKRACVGCAHDDLPCRHFSHVFLSCLKHSIRLVTPHFPQCLD